MAELATVARPTPGPEEVLVQVAAAGISRAALHLLTGRPLLLRLGGFGVRAPKHPVGVELAGTVVEVGHRVTRLHVGDEVFGYGAGTCATYSVAKADKLAVRPGGLPAAQAAVLVDSASTALQAVRDHGGVRAGQRVLVLGASGGVGSYAVQIAKTDGAHVSATSSAPKVAFVRSLGADAVIDHGTEDPLAVAAPFDVIIDIGGNRPVKAMRRALGPTGTLVIVGGEGGGPIIGGFGRQLVAPIRGIGSKQTLKTFVADEHHRHLEELADLAISGAIRAVVDHTHVLGDASEALRRMEAGQIRGKDVVIVVDEDRELI